MRGGFALGALATVAVVTLVASSCSTGDPVSGGSGSVAAGGPTTTLLIDRLLAPARTTPDGAPAPAGTAPIDLVVPPRPSLGCGGGLVAGDDHIGLTSSGVQRASMRHRPLGYDGTRAAPLVIDLHAYTESAAVHAAFDGLADTADRHGFLLVTPSGTGDSPIWNSARSPFVSDDVMFVRDLLHTVESTDCVDSNRIYVTGLSNGGLMASQLACSLSEQIAAVAPVAGVTVPADCAPTRAVPTIAFHGTADTFLEYGGGLGPSGDGLMTTPQSVAVFKNLDRRSVPDLMSDWARRNGCTALVPDQQLGADVVLRRWAGCGADVQLYTVEGGGHSWPGSAAYRAAPGIGTTTMTIDANELMWAFFEQHPLIVGA